MSDYPKELLWEKLSMISVCRWMVSLPAQILARRQAGEDWVRAVSDYTIGDLTVQTRATAKSRKHYWRAWVRLLLAEPRTTFQYPIGEQMGQPALLAYQRSSFRTVCPTTSPMVVCTRLWIALKRRLKQQ